MWIGKRRLKYLILKNQTCTFIFGFVIGALVAVIVHTFIQNPPFMASIWPAARIHPGDLGHNYENSPYDFAYEHWLNHVNQAQSCPLNPDTLRYTNQTEFDTKKCGKIKFPDDILDNFIRDFNHFDPRTESKYLYDEVSTK